MLVPRLCPYLGLSRYNTDRRCNPINRAAKLSQSLFSEPISRNTQTENFNLVSDTELRVRTRSIDQLTTRVPLPQIKFVKEGGNTCARY